MHHRITLLAGILLFLAHSLQAAVVLSDDFSGYTTGPINGDGGNPQTGSYTDNWAGTTSGGLSNFTADERLQITRPSGSFNGGYYSRINPAGSANGGNVLYFSAQLTLDSGVEGAAFGLDLDGRTNLVGINSAGNAAIWNQPNISTTNSATTYNDVFTNDETAVGTSAYTFGNTYLLVGKIEDAANWGGGNDRVTLWVDPLLGSLEGANSHEVQVEVGFNGLFPANSSIDNFWFLAATNNAGESAYLDDLIIATDWAEVTAIPEPSTIALVSLAFVVAHLRSRKRR